jgi:D-amino peptidase
MKIYISSDIEGISGVTSWSETELNNRDSAHFIKEYASDINAICDVANENGYEEIYVNDAHDTGRNLIPASFSKYVKLIRGWSGHPYMMLEGLDDTFDCVMFVGYHSGANSIGNPISHTMYPRIVSEIKINNQVASEFLIFYYTALYVGVPVVLITGDQYLCHEVNSINNNIYTITTKEGFSGATINYNPTLIRDEINKASKEILSEKDYKKYLRKLPEDFTIEITYRKHSDAYRNSFYQGAKLINTGYTLQYTTDDYFEILRFLSFVAT